MRYRRFGQSDLVVSEVGFGTWTLVTDWWGRTDDPHAMITAALDAGINFIDTAPVYGTEGAGESILAPYLTVPRRHRAHHEVRLRHQGRAQVPRPVGAPRTTGAPSRSARSAKTRCAASEPTASTSTSCTTRASSRSSPTTCGTRCSSSSAKARCASSASRSVRRSVGSKRASARSTTGRSCRCRPSSTCSSRSPGARSRQRPACSERRGRSDLARAARLRLAVGEGHARHRVPQGRPPRAPQPRQHARQLREGRDALVPVGARDRPHDRPGRDRRDPRRSRVHVRAAHRALGRRRRRSTRPPPTSRSPPTSAPRSTRSGQRNFDHVDRYVMPLKSSV